VVIVEVVAKYWLASDLEFIRMNKISDGDELTANSSIKARVDLFNDEDAGETERPMNTSNAPIDATLALVSATRSFPTRRQAASLRSPPQPF